MGGHHTHHRRLTMGATRRHKPWGAALLQGQCRASSEWMQVAVTCRHLHVFATAPAARRLVSARLRSVAPVGQISAASNWAWPANHDLLTFVDIDFTMQSTRKYDYEAATRPHPRKGGMAVPTLTSCCSQRGDADCAGIDPSPSQEMWDGRPNGRNVSIASWVRGWPTSTRVARARTIPGGRSRFVISQHS